ncbi:MAG: ATP-binding protein [Armatimonadetes bacterium]|nr:ATP-binding protein [Armatimonadota bacterium]
MQDFEKLGLFYLGRAVDDGQPVLYDSSDLVTHGVCIGMTGSGKTGLCVGLIEEALIDSIPVIAVDPKGDLGNLLLNFPQLRPEDFAPWTQQPAETAQRWRDGLAAWGQDGARIQRLRDAAEFRLYTPGSRSGRPVSIMRPFDAPSADEDEESRRERIHASVSALLGLLGIEADPLQSREHILLSTIVQNAWQAGRSLDLGGIISEIQKPPVTRVGVMDVDTFFPPKERSELAMRLNNLLASPSFAAWSEGEPLDIDRILYTESGRPRAAIFSIAHLGDAERMFFVSLLLSNVVGWMRRQSGSASLRALLFMDEIAGYFPPVANPPSKPPLLTLLKQARAFGLGVLLATQNPVDLDYKGLSNTGTWFIGRLQTERDKQRVMEGLEGASAGRAFDRAKMESVLAGLGSRKFLLHNVHEDEDVVFETRWTLSYLAGPLTRAQLKQLGGFAPTVPAPSTLPAPAASRPVVDSAIPQYFLAARGLARRVIYRPMLFGEADVQFVDAKRGVDSSHDIRAAVDVVDGPLAVEWERAQALQTAACDLESEPLDGAGFAPLPSAAANVKKYAAWSRDFAGWIYATQQLELFTSPSLKQTSRPGEDERAFRIRLLQVAREQRDAEKEKLRRAYASKLTTAEDGVRRAEHAVQREEAQSRDSMLSTALQIGGSLLGSFMGRRTSMVSAGVSAARGVGRSATQASDVRRAEQNLQVASARRDDLQFQFQADLAAVEARVDPSTEVFETTAVKPKKANISVRLLALAWAPHDAESGKPLWE